MTVGSSVSQRGGMPWLRPAPGYRAAWCSVRCRALDAGCCAALRGDNRGLGLATWHRASSRSAVLPCAARCCALLRTELCRQDVGCCWIDAVPTSRRAVVKQWLGSGWFAMMQPNGWAGRCRRGAGHFSVPAPTRSAVAPDLTGSGRSTAALPRSPWART